MHCYFRALIFILALIFSNGARAAFDCTTINPESTYAPTTAASPTADFSFRDGLPQTEVSKEKWQSCCGTFGPCPITYPKVIFPNESLRVAWSRERAVEAAKRLIGTRYAHRHIPQMGGLDCSNFTAFVYNYALGIRIKSNVELQAEQAGRRLDSTTPLEAGDLVFIYNSSKSSITHAVLYIDKNHIIDDTGPGVQVRAFEGWYKDRQAWARRIIE